MIGGPATVGRLSNKVFLTFQAIRPNFEKSCWLVTRQWSEVTRPLVDCRTTFFRRFKQFGEILKNVAERSRDRGWRSRDRWPTGQTTFIWRLKQFRNFLEKVAERSRDSGRRSRDRWSIVKERFFDVSSNSEEFREKSLNGHVTVVGGHATVGRL